MIRKLALVLGVATLAVVVMACEAAKSSNPLSSSVAGPIPGVNITSPRIMQPTPGQRGSSPISSRSP